MRVAPGVATALFTSSMEFSTFLTTRNLGFTTVTLPVLASNCYNGLDFLITGFGDKLWDLRCF